VGYTKDLLSGLARDLAAGTIGVWRTNGIYQGNETGIILGVFPDKPVNVIALTAYPVSDDPVSDDVIGIQVRTRRDGQDTGPGMDLADQIHERWHMAHDLTLPGGVFVKQLERRSATSGGRDSAGRSSFIQNFYATVPRRLPHRP
jgi:hypothetical protein